MTRRKSDIGEESVLLAATLQDVVSPIAAAAVDYPDKCVCPPHSHRRAQLIHASSGVMTVHTSDGAWVVPPNRALWVPPRVEHSIVNSGLVRLRTIYIEPALARRMPARCSVAHVSPLLRELLLAALDIPVDRKPKGRHALVMKLILDEIKMLPVLPLHLPIPEASAISPMCREIIDHPGAPHPLDSWSERIGLSSRTIERHFVKETGMTFTRWRQQARLIGSLPRLARGEAVLQVALDLGYESPSAFAAMFRRTLGVPPSTYFADGERHHDGSGGTSGKGRF